jgi:hypothetical protein
MKTKGQKDTYFCAKSARTWIETRSPRSDTEEKLLASVGDRGSMRGVGNKLSQEDLLGYKRRAGKVHTDEIEELTDLCLESEAFTGHK